MAHFDKNSDMLITVDASPVGLLGILPQRANGQQEGRIIAYASRALSDVERGYSQAEKEVLSILWAIEHFHLYLYGATFTLITDHKLLEVIYGSPKSKPSARIERWVLRLQPYDFRVDYRPRSTNQADFLSRHPSKTTKAHCTNIADEYVNFISEFAVHKNMTLHEVQKPTDQDRVMKAVRASIRLNKWNTDTVKPFLRIKDELTIGKSNIILRGTRIVIPDTLQKKPFNLAHATHQELAKMKALNREEIWFPGIDKSVKDMIGSC